MRAEMPADRRREFWQACLWYRRRLPGSPAAGARCAAASALTLETTDGVDRPLRAFTPRFSSDDGLHSWALLVRI
jgi:hypothetical protein